MMVWLVGFLLLVGTSLLWVAGRQQAAADLPRGRVIYLDTGSLRPWAQPLYDPQTGLTGKPDYLLRQHGNMIPVEVKSSRAPLQPFPSHVMQAAAYCYLVQAVYGKRPPHAVLTYQDKSFSIAYDHALEERLLDLVHRLRAEGEREQDRSHTSINRCKACSYRSACDQSLI